jgi:hypothetical protein
MRTTDTRPARRLVAHQAIGMRAGTGGRSSYSPGGAVTALSLLPVYRQGAIAVHDETSVSGRTR